MYIASGCISRPPKECDPPAASLRNTERATRKFKKGASSQKNPRGGTCTCILIIACNHMG